MSVMAFTPEILEAKQRKAADRNLRAEDRFHGDFLNSSVSVAMYKILP